LIYDSHHYPASLQHYEWEANQVTQSDDPVDMYRSELESQESDQVFNSLLELEEKLN
jgi:hypothetical protein